MTDTPVNPCFTAAQIAAALGRTRQAVAASLAKTLADSAAVASGQTVSAWQLESLPAILRADLEAAARRQRYRDARHMLEKPGERWQHPVALRLVNPVALAKATKLRAVFAATLQQKDSTAISQGQREQAGIAGYQKEFGHPISARHWRRLFHRILDRDRNQCDWQRIDLYLEDNISPTRVHRGGNVSHGIHSALPDALADTVKTLQNPASPTTADRAFIFDAALRHLEDQPEAKRKLIAALYRALPALAKTEKALRCMFNRKQAAWTKAGGDPAALEDRRRFASGNFRKPDFTDDLKRIRDTAILHGGNISLAHRKLREDGALSDEFVNHYNFDPRHNKSYLPASVRDAITPEVEMCAAIHRGPWQARMAGPYIMRDWSAVQPADWISGDDVTWNNYWYRYDDAGQLHIERGECLVLHDLRTGYILDYLLIAGKYNSRHIRKLIARVHDRHGLPHCGFYFERGVWKARIIRDLDSRENIHWRETESGLAAFNLQVRHATTPRAKIIEGLFRIIQERQRNEPGFVGFNERIEDMERMQDYLARVRRGTARPEEKLLSMEQWTKRLDEICGHFNSDVQNGKLLQGQSPAEAWQAGLHRKPLRQLPEEARYLLATHCIRVKVRQQGILLTIGGNKMLFANQHTGQLIGHDVLAFYNFDCPEVLTVSDLNRQNYFTVKSISAPAMSATREQFGQAQTAIAGHRRAAKEIYGRIQHPIIATIIRDDTASEDAKDLGRFVNTEVEQHRQQQTERASKSRTVTRRAAAAGLNLTQPVRDLDAAIPAIDRLAQARARARARETQNHGETK